MASSPRSWRPRSGACPTASCGRWRPAAPWWATSSSPPRSASAAPPTRWPSPGFVSTPRRSCRSCGPGPRPGPHVAPVSSTSRFARAAPYVFILLWSSSFVTARVGLRVISPLLFVGVRLVIASVILGVASLGSARPVGALRDRWVHLAIAGALVNGVTLSAFHVGMVTENVAVMALLQSLSPLAVALSAVPLLGERLRASQWLGLVLGIAGVAMVVAPRALENPTGWRAIALGVVGAGGLAGGTLYFRRFCRDTPLLLATAVQVAA